MLPAGFGYGRDTSENVVDLTPEILKQLQEGFAALRAQGHDVSERLDKVANRVENLEALVRKRRRDPAAMLVMMPAVAGDLEERVSDVEERMVALEGKRGG